MHCSFDVKIASFHFVKNFTTNTTTKQDKLNLRDASPQINLKELIMRFMLPDLRYSKRWFNFDKACIQIKCYTQERIVFL